MDDLIERVKKKAHRRSNLEIALANYEYYESMGLDFEDLERMADAANLDVEAILFLPSGCSGSPRTKHVIGKPGRKTTPRDIADFAAKRRNHMTWNETCAEWNQCYPDRTKTAEQIREAYRRHYGDKAGKKY